MTLAQQYPGGCLADAATHLPFMVAVKERYVRPPYPAWTAIGVSSLIAPRGITEIKAIVRMCRAAAGSAAAR